MILVKCDRSGCKTEAEAPSSLASGVLPRGWLYLVEGTRATAACGTACFDTIWRQRMWRDRKGRPAMEELAMSEEALLPKG